MGVNRQPTRLKAGTPARLGAAEGRGPRQHAADAHTATAGTRTAEPGEMQECRSPAHARSTAGLAAQDPTTRILDNRVYSWEQVDAFVEAYLNGANRGQLDPALDVCVEEYLKLDEDGQVEFKSSAKAFTRLYAFLSQVLPYGNANWEKLSIFLNFLIDKLPAPVEPDLSRGVLEAVDMDSYRMERKAAQSISGRGGRRDKPSPPGRWRRSP